MVVTTAAPPKRRREGSGARKRVWEKKKQKLFLARQQKKHAEASAQAMSAKRPSKKGAQKKKKNSQVASLLAGVTHESGSNVMPLIPSPQALQSQARAAGSWPSATGAPAIEQPWLNIPPPGAGTGLQVAEVGSVTMQQPSSTTGSSSASGGGGNGAGAGGVEGRGSSSAITSVPSTHLPAFAPPQWEILQQAHELERKIQPLLHEPAIGLDIEWRPTFVAGQPRNKVALLQLSSMNRCMLLPLRHMKTLPKSLSTLLSSPRVYKVGCGVAEDASKLLEDYGLNCSPTLEIGDAAVRLQRSASEGGVEGGGPGLSFPALPEGEVVRPGLKSLALACGYELSKPKKVTRSNWESPRLTPQQQKYAALDAYAGVWIARCVHALHAPHVGAPDFASWLRRMHSEEQQAKGLPVSSTSKKSRKRKAKEPGHGASP